MEKRGIHQVVIIGATSKTERLRRRLEQRGLQVLGVAAHVKGLRSLLVTAPERATTVCVSLDAQTTRRLGRQIAAIGRDFLGSSSPVRMIGLLDERGMTAQAAESQCDVYVSGVGEALRAMSGFSRTLKGSMQESRFSKVPRAHSSRFRDSSLNHANRHMGTGLQRVRRRGTDDLQPRRGCAGGNN